MMHRRARPGIKAANDNFVRAHRSGARREPAPVVRFPGSASQPFRIRSRSLPVAVLAGLILVALSGAFLVGLAAIGLLAVAVLAIEREPRLRALGDRVVRWARARG